MLNEENLQSSLAGTSVETELNLHKKIKRIEGIGGHAPAFYCCVCGKSTKKNSSIITCTTDCPNICHPDCADPDGIFHCSQVKQLREKLSISQDVVYVFSYNTDDNSVTQTAPDSLSDTDSCTDRDNIHDTVNESSQDLLQIIKDQQATITKLLQHLTVFTDGKLTLAELPSAITSAKKIITESLVSTSSVKVTARAVGIDADFSRSSQQNPSLKTWWVNTPLGQKVLSRTTPVPSPPNQSSSSRTAVTQPTPAVGPRIAARQPPASQQPGLPAALPTNTVYSNSSSSTRLNNVIQARGGRNQTKNQKPTPPVCSNCGRRGHLEIACRSKLVCDFCNLKGHTRDSCRWKASDDRSNSLEQEVRTLISQLRHSSQSQVIHQPQVAHQPQVTSQPQVTHHPQAIYQPQYTYQHQVAPQPQVIHQPQAAISLQPQRYLWPPQNWPASQWTPAPWMRSS